jgi:uncharacterized protein YqeY
MTIVERMRQQLKEAMKARDAVRTGFLRYWIAQLTLGTGEEMVEADAIKKMRGVLREARTGQTTFTPEEVALLQEWVPAALTADQIAAALQPARDAIRAASKDGMAMGLAMKALAGQPVEADDVKVVVASIRASS